MEDYCDNDEEPAELRPVMAQPIWTIRGGPSIKQYTILNDKRHVLTRDTEENVVLWDILKVRNLTTTKCWVDIIGSEAVTCDLKVDSLILLLLNTYGMWRWIFDRLLKLLVFIILDI